jgi:uncharacterized protein (DUF362 family)
MTRTERSRSRRASSRRLPQSARAPDRAPTREGTPGFAALAASIDSSAMRDKPRTRVSDRVAIVEDRAHAKDALLETALERAGFWRHLQATCVAFGSAPDALSIVVKPDLVAFDRAPSLATDPELVEHLIDLLAARGYTRVTVADATDWTASWLTNRAVPFLADLLGYRYVTREGRAYEVVDLAEDLVRAPFPEGFALRGRRLGRVWIDADYRINFAKAKTHEIFAYALCVHNLLSILPPDSPHVRAGTPIAPADIAFELWQATPAEFNILDAVVSNHGSFGSHILSPLETHAVLAGANALAVDWVAALKMGADPYASSLNRHLLERLGEPTAEIDGSLAPFVGWRAVHPLVIEVYSRMHASPRLGAALARATTRVNRELFPFQRVEDDVVNETLAPMVDVADGNALACAILLGGLGATAFLAEGQHAWQVFAQKSAVPWIEVPLDMDLARYADVDYEAIAPYIASLERLMIATPPDVRGLRWRYLQGSVVFQFGCVFDAPFDEFRRRIEITRAVQVMNDFIGGTAVAIRRDAAGRVTRQAERTVFLPQPNYMAFWGGLPIDVGKIEEIVYAADREAIYWRTVSSANGSGEYDDGSVVVAAEGGTRTRVTVTGRQKFALPYFWRMVNLDLVPEIKNALVAHAYQNYFERTMHNLHSLYEGREARVGHPWSETDATPLDLTRMLRALTEAMTTAVPYATFDTASRNVLSMQWAEGAVADDQGFVHVRGRGAAATATSLSSQPEMDPLAQLRGFVDRFGPELARFLREFGDAVRWDLGWRRDA